jgi:hypothetical protein
MYQMCSVKDAQIVSLHGVNMCLHAGLAQAQVPQYSPLLQSLTRFQTEPQYYQAHLEQHKFQPPQREFQHDCSYDEDLQREGLEDLPDVEVEKALKQKDAVIADLREQLAELTSTVESMTEVREKDAVIADLRGQLAELTSTVESMTEVRDREVNEKEVLVIQNSEYEVKLSEYQVVNSEAEDRSLTLQVGA